MYVQLLLDNFHPIKQYYDYKLCLPECNELYLLNYFNSIAYSLIYCIKIINNNGYN